MSLDRESAPSCPSCDRGPMILRTNARTGNRFYGCRFFPDCTGTRQVDDANSVDTPDELTAGDDRRRQRDGFPARRYEGFDHRRR